MNHPAEKGIKSTAAGILANALLALCKGAAGIFGNSYALVADAIESASDVLSSFVVLIGLKISAIPKDENHPYGHGKAEPIAAVIVSLSLIGAAVVIAVQSVHGIMTPHQLPEPFTLAVLAGVVFVKEFLFRKVLQVGEEVESTAVKTDAWHHRSDAITSAAAFVGISIALFMGKGWESADDWAALFAAFIIAFNAYNLFRPAFSEIMDGAPSEEIASQIRSVAFSVEGVIALHKCKVRKMGFDYFVDLHILVDAEITVREGHSIGHAVKDAIRLNNPRITDAMIHIEPAD